MYIQDMLEINCLGRIKPLFSQGYYVKDGKITRDRIGPEIDSPWIMHNVNRPDLDCGKWHTILFEHFRVIPKECFNCYKVVVRPRNVDELIKLSDLQKGMLVSCKAGIEIREYVDALYGGYFYCKGLEEGRQRYSEVRALVDLHLSKDTHVYLKRACTEYEMMFGDSDKWEYDERESYYSKWIEDNFDAEVFGRDMYIPEYINLDTKLRWFGWASQHGDHSYLKYSRNNDTMDTKPITYER